MGNNLTRRNFLAGSAAAAALAGLAGCSTGGTAATDAAASLPTADKYPIDPDGSDVQAKWTSEEVRDGWTRYTMVAPSWASWTPPRSSRWMAWPSRT